MLYHFPRLLSFPFCLNLSLFKAFQLYFQWEDGGGPEKDQNLLLELVLHNLTLGNSSLLSSSLLLSVTSAGLVSAFLSSFSSFSPSLLLDFWLPTEPSSDAFLFLSCQYSLPPLLCTLLLGTPYFLAISTWDFLLMTQSLTAIRSNADCSPTLLIVLCNFFSALSPCTFGSYSSCTVLGSSVTYHCLYIEDTFSSVVTLTMGNIGIPAR